jgi:hypothetical protein
MALTTAESILTFASRKPPQKLHIRALGQEVYLLDPTADDRDQFDIWIRDAKAAGKDIVGVRGLVAALLLCDENGERLFGADDADKLGKLPPTALQDIFDIGTKLLAVSDKETEELAEKSAASP